MKPCVKYGEVFKKLRKQKGFKLTSFIQVGISPAALCKFENGKSMIKFDKFNLALSALSITLSEYEKCLKDFHLEVHEMLIKKTITIIISGEYDDLKECYVEFMRLNERACAIAVKSMYEKLSGDDLDWIGDYFDSLTYWRYIDLYTLYLMVDCLKVRQLAYLLEGFFISDGFYKIFNSQEHRGRFAHIVCKSVICLSYKGHEQMTKHFLDYINPQKFNHTMYTKNLYDFAKGYWCAEFESRIKGDQMMKKALLRFKELSAPGVSEYYEKICEKYKN
ncbi:Rgg/GadR/MutR family transcriptional regulator [Lactococcus taiwanensis]|uniref:Rgg/GadR/MutR family transcriptional regulator n=1 Tax=Lactococcus taiwanensis TaxID=1151742 RepID=UPI0035172E65